MKNVTIAIDAETHRRARIRAAELGTSLSALVKDYLNGLALADEAPAAGVREMPMPFKQAEPVPAGPPWLINGQWSYTKDGKPRQPGSLRGKFKSAELAELADLETPDWLIDIMEGAEDDFSDILPFDESQIPR